MTYNVLIQPQSGGTYRATVLGWPDITATGNSEQTAIERVRRAIRERLGQGKLIRVEVDEDIAASSVEHSWLRTLGMWKDDPTFDDFLARMDADRRELDTAS